jgi:LPPG:FO 2-phospho-L-lactate transferase
LQISARTIPMSDDAVRTVIQTPDGDRPFQDYFVRLACAVPVTGVRYDGAATAKVNPDLDRLAGVSAIVICPSNPYLSVDPILAVPGMRAWMKAQSVPIVAVSPIVGGAAIKGPAAKIMQELGVAATATTVARHYGDLLDGIVIDTVDAGLRKEIEASGIAVCVAPAVMRSTDDRVALARTCLAFARDIGEARPR